MQRLERFTLADMVRDRGELQRALGGSNGAGLARSNGAKKPQLAVVA
ncbi:MAG: hypothetical protein U0163_04090 [Gemmatimonadaceae bacterium]